MKNENQIMELHGYDHLPECHLSYRCHGLTGIAGNHEMKMDFCTACRRVCICSDLRACEQRVLEASVAAVREAIGEEWQGEIVPKGEYDCCGCSSYNGIVNDATNAIRALKEKP